MARRDLSNKNFSEHASGELDSIIKRQADEKKTAVPTVTAEEAMREKRMLEYKSTRDVTRVLFISQNTELLNPTKQSLDGYLNISEVFDEVHILILRQGIEPKQPVIRPEKNVYMYTVATRFWWLTPVAGIDMIKAQLVFADGFRPDMIVALDPFESALVALWASKKFNRPAQLHVLINFLHPSFLELEKANRWRKLIANYTVPKFLSIRAATGRILDRLREKTDIADLERLPQLNPYEALSKQEQLLDLKEKYPQYVFTILFIGSLNDSSAAFLAIDAARYMLRNPKVCMIIMGDGPGKQECVQRVKMLGIEKQVIFERQVIDYVQYIKAADLLIATNTDGVGEEIVLQAAGAGLPMVMVRTDLRDDIFTHRESAYMCDIADTQAQSDGVYEMMNDYELRNQVAEQAFTVISNEFHQDPEEYRTQYQFSVEAAMFAEGLQSDIDKKSEAAENTETGEEEVEE